MQLFRNLVWWVIGLTTLAVFVIVLLLSNLFAGQFWQIPTRSIAFVYVGLFLGLFNRLSVLRLGETLIHEIGHAQMAALTFGKVKFIRVERDTSGVTYHTQGFLLRRLSSTLISLFGPISSAVFFVITARFVASELTAYWAIGISVFTILILISTIRNLWGWITGLVILAILYLILESTGYVAPLFLNESSLITSNNILVEVILGITAFNLGSSIQYSFAVRKSRNPNSDEFKFSRSLFIPFFLGSHLIIIIELLLGWYALSILLGWPSMIQIGRFI